MVIFGLLIIFMRVINFFYGKCVSPRLNWWDGGPNIVPVAQRIARWTSNPKVVGSIPARDVEQIHIWFRFVFFFIINH